MTERLHVGAQIGCDYQFASTWVVGVEGAAAGGILKATRESRCRGLPGDNATFSQTTDFLSSITARVGYAWDHWLFYAKGGVAWAGDRYSAFDQLGDVSILKVWKLGSAGRRARASNGRFGMIGRSGSNTTITALARTA